MTGKRSWRKVYALNNEQSVTLGYGEMISRFVAGVLFPHDLGTISFDDLYALRIPMFLPSRAMVVSMALAHLRSTKNYPWYMLREEHAKLPPAHADIGRLPWNPGWDGADALNSSEHHLYIGSTIDDIPG